MTVLPRCQLLYALSILWLGGVRSSEIKCMEGHKVRDDYVLPLPHSYIDPSELPGSFTWGDVDGVSYLTHSLNQHLPQFCGSCWAHAALSALADRIKIARKAIGDDVNLSIQYILNCGGHVAGSCHGGTHTGVYEFIRQTGFAPYDTCMPYLACSSDSKEGFCTDLDTSCSPINTCRTCQTSYNFSSSCKEVELFPNATVAEYGTIRYDVSQIKAEIFARGPVAANIAGKPLHTYEGGVFSDDTASKNTTHVVSIVGWGIDDKGSQYWIVRNSWGQAWGELGFFRIELGRNLLGIESDVAWATPGEFSSYPPCNGGDSCGAVTQRFVDPSLQRGLVQQRLQSTKQ